MKINVDLWLSSLLGHKLCSVPQKRLHQNSQCQPQLLVFLRSPDGRCSRGCERSSPRILPVLENAQSSSPHGDRSRPSLRQTPLFWSSPIPGPLFPTSIDRFLRNSPLDSLS